MGQEGEENKAGRKEMTAEEGGKEREREREASEWVLRCLSESICQIVFTV